MKSFRHLTLIVCFTLFSLLPNQAQEMDKELSDLAGKLAPLIKDNGKKKVTVLDFTDLQGNGSELGRYIAEELTVNLVMNKREFSVLDRANLKRILAEHKLTAQGLVDPENAKKLGQFAGVDALILGNIIPKTQKVGLTAKIISTDTAEIVGAAKAEFKTDEIVQELLSRATTDIDEAGDSQASNRDKSMSKAFGDLSIAYESLLLMKDGSISVNLLFKNTSSTKAIAVGMHSNPVYIPPGSLRSTLTGGDGTECYASTDGITGIKGIRALPRGLTQIAPGKEINVSLKYSPNRRLSANIKSFRLQAEMVVNDNYKESQYDNYRADTDVLPPFCKIENLVFDITLNK